MENVNGKIVIKLNEEDLNKIQAAHYLVNSTADLINRLALRVIEPDNSEEALKKYMELYSGYFKDYDNIKTEIEKKYKPIDKEFKFWSIDFDEETITFEE